MQDQLANINDDMTEKFLVLDTRLRVVNASPAFYKAFNVGPLETLDRQLAELGSGQWSDAELLRRLHEFIAKGEVFEVFEMQRDFPAIGARTILVSARRSLAEGNGAGAFVLAIEDVTGQRSTAAEAADQRFRFEAALSGVTDAVIVTDLRGLITFMNPIAERLTGWAQKDALAKPLGEVFNIVDEHLRKPVDAPVPRVIRDGAITGLAGLTTLVAYDGTQRPIDDSAAPIRDAAGKIIGVMLIFRTVTDRCRREKRLAISELRYRRLFETAHDGILILDARTGRVLDANRFMLDLLQYPIEHFLGKELWEIGVFRDAKASKDAMMVLQQVGSISYEDLPLVAKNGGHIPVEFVGNVYRETDHNVIQCNIRDITERKEAASLDSRMAAIVESSDDAIMSQTLDGLIATWNPGAERMFGYTVAEVVGRPVSLLYPPNPPDEEPDILERLRRGERVEHYETVRVARNGTPLHVSLTASPIRDLDGRVVGASKILRDITARKQVEGELSKAKEEADSANRAKSEFLANMSHEIRTPMTAILGFADMILQAGQTEDGRRECVQVIRRNGTHLLELINQILDLSKIEEGLMAVENIPCELTGLLADVVAIARPRATEKGLEFEMVIKCPVPRVIQTDPLRLRQILVNLLGNAIKFTLAGKITLTVRTEGAGAGHLLCAEVADSGIGMAAEQLGRLFRPFSQADDSITRKFGGTGLGLTISRQLAQLLGGDIEVKSELGIGSTFTVRVSGGSFTGVEMLTNLHEKMLPSAAPADKWRDLPLRGRILLVEDGRDNQRLLSRHLTVCGAEVSIAENGRVALDLATKESFDLILMDMQMPVMDGYTATAELRSRGFTTPIVALTAYAMADDRKKCIASGCTDYLGKPIDRDVLLETVSRHLGDSRSKAALKPATPLATPGEAKQTSMISSTIKKQPGMPSVIAEFVDGLPDQVRRMTSLLNQNDLSGLRCVVHQIRGAGGGYGFASLTESATTAEGFIDAPGSAESIAEKVNALVDLMRHIEGYGEIRPSVLAPPKQGIELS